MCKRVTVYAPLKISLGYYFIYSRLITMVNAIHWLGGGSGSGCLSLSRKSYSFSDFLCRKGILYEDYIACTNSKACGQMFPRHSCCYSTLYSGSWLSSPPLEEGCQWGLLLSRMKFSVLYGPTLAKFCCRIIEIKQIDCVTRIFDWI